ncbi:unnamed protein product, partial [Timema podura]|nr:unnamed protein product [Timema podura]
MLHKELRKRFLSVWTFPEKGLVLVKKVSADERSDLVDFERKSSSLEHDVIKSMLGFSRVFKLLTELGKPLVGHNLLLDLALMYAQFHEPLPCIAQNAEMKANKEWKEAKARFQNKWVSNVLNEMYMYFKNSNGVSLALYSPSIKSTNGYNLKATIILPFSTFMSSPYCSTAPAASSLSKSSSDFSQILKEHFMKQVGTLTVLSTAFTSVVVHFVLHTIVLSFPWQYWMSASAGNPPLPFDQGRLEPSPFVDTCCQVTQALNGRNPSQLLDAFFHLLVAPARILLSGSFKIVLQSQHPGPAVSA